VYHKNHFDVGVGTITVRIRARDARLTAAWAEKLKVPYAGQSLGSFTHLVIDALLRQKHRRYLTDAEKAELRTNQGNCCNLCGDVLDGFTEYDHVVPLNQTTSEQSAESFQALCSQCHADKSVSEAKPSEACLRSRFCPTLHKSYVAALHGLQRTRRRGHSVLEASGRQLPGRGHHQIAF
jgi:nitrate/TMAO reductase-like tetraheme cytochrome c subunit